MIGHSSSNSFILFPIIILSWIIYNTSGVVTTTTAAAAATVNTITISKTTVVSVSTIQSKTRCQSSVLLLRGGASSSSTRISSKVAVPSSTSVKKIIHKNKKGEIISGTGTATITNEIFNLVKGIVGVGVLSLPAGIGNFGNHPTVLIPSLLLIMIMGILSAYGFAIIGKVCSYTNASTYREAWAKSINEQTSWIPALSATCKTFLACLALSMVLADTFVGLLRVSNTLRTSVLIAITTTILLPLCWMKNLSALAPFSLLGVLGMGFTAIAMTIRYIDQSYVVGSGKFVSHLASHLQPNFGTDGWESVFQPSSLILLCMLSTAYMAHFNAPKFYQELYNNTLQRYHTVVASSFGISILMIGYITAVGFLTFGNAASGLVLNNYSSQDIWMSTSRIAVAVALVFSYPLAFQGCRDGIIDLIQSVQPSLLQRTPTTLNVMTLILLVLLTTLAATLKDVSFVLALGGATLGNALTYLYPALMYSAIVKKQNRKDQTTGVFIANMSAVLGVVMGIIGAKMALEK